jgi:hypothetical protein
MGMRDIPSIAELDRMERDRNVDEATTALQKKLAASRAAKEKAEKERDDWKRRFDFMFDTFAGKYTSNCYKYPFCPDDIERHTNRDCGCAFSKEVVSKRCLAHIIAYIDAHPARKRREAVKEEP